MAPSCSLLSLLPLALNLASLTQGLKLNTFAGQAEAVGLQNAVQDKTPQEATRLLAVADTTANDEYVCTKTKGCAIGCCGPLDEKGNGVCGLGPKFFGDGCTSTCQYKSECDPGWGIQWSNATKCPLNVCCSEYGFCGTDADYCKGVKVTSPSCGKDSRTSEKRTIGYYEGWNYQRPCGNMEPEDIPLGYYTHINFAFALINPKTFRMDVMDEGTASRYSRVTALKAQQSDLKVWIAIGGWAMNDPGPYRTTFSDLAKSESAQNEFFQSLISFLKRYDFDGVDIDWEYPVADDRGGITADFASYVNFLSRLRQALNGSGKEYGVSITLPASYWYLKGFDIIKLEPHVDWFNIMTYDIHGVWDQTVKSMGPYAFAHTNLTEINSALELLWRNNINPSRVVMGLGFYGRSFTMKDPGCMAAGCEFSEGAKGGECTGTSGVLSAAEINKIIKGGAKVTYDEKAAVKIVTWDSNQWVSWDDTETLKVKMDYANERCLGGTMVWAIDLDDGTMIDALGKNLKRKKEEKVKIPHLGDCFGTGELKPKDEL